MNNLFVQAIEAIYDAAPDPARWPQALQAIADYFDDVGAVLVWQRDDGSFGTIASPMLEAAQKDYAENGWNSRDLPAIRAIERGLWITADAATDRHAVTEEEIATHPFYTEFLARHGLRWRLSIGVAPDQRIAAAISIQRASSKPPFSDEELERATRLGRHAEKSLRLSIRVFDAEFLEVGLGEALARVGIGVFALDSLGRVVFANPAAELLQGDGLTVVNNRLLAGASSNREKLETEIEQMIRAAPDDIVRSPKPVLIHRAKSERPLVVYVLPFGVSPNPAAQFLSHARAIILVIDPEAGSPAEATVVRDVLGLTLGEARLAALVGTGLSPRESAQKLGITEETARSVLKRVFSKTGIARQSELTALLTKLVLR